MTEEQTNSWEEGMTEFERTSNFGMVLRDWINWYKQDGTDHGDLVIAEEAIIRKHNQVISQEKEKMIEEFKKQIEDIDCCCEGGCTASVEFKENLLDLLQNK